MKLASLFLAAMMVLGLTACSGDNDSGKTGDKAAAPAAATAAPSKAKAYNPDKDTDGDC